MNILAIGASTSSTSIDRKLASYAARQVPKAQVTDLDLNTFDLPIYSSDQEEIHGIVAGVIPTASKFSGRLPKEGSPDPVRSRRIDPPGDYLKAL